MEMEDKDSLWVQSFIAKLQTAKNGVLSVQIGGTNVSAVVSQDLITFFIGNQDLLVNLGRENFAAFLAYLCQKKQEEAFMVLLQKMSVDQMIAELKGEAGLMQKYNDDMDNFIKKLKAFAISVLLPLTAKVLLGALLG